jgi:hypothetical protein
MSRKFILSLATVATIAAAATLASSAADARGFGGGGFGGGGGHMMSFSRGGNFGGARVFGTHFTGNHFNFNRFPGRFTSIRRPFPPIWWHHHHHWHWWWHDGQWSYVEAPVEPVVGPVAPVATPGPCTCLTKTYTQDGLVVFADVCTKEAASAPVGGGGGETPPPAKSSEATPPAPPTNVAEASQTPSTNNYAGKTYQDFLAATGQTQKN